MRLRWIAAAVCALALALPAFGRDLAPGAVPLPEGPQEGSRLFEQLRCATCHTVGDGRDRGGPNLGRLNLRLSFLDGAALLWNHTPGMQDRMREVRIPYPAINGDQLVNLVAFFTSYQYYLTRVGRPGVAARGEVLFRTKGCASCHSLEPGAPSAGPNLSSYGGGRSTLEVAQAMWNHGPQMQRTLEVRGIPRPYFREREMADLLTFIATRGAPPGTTTAYLEPGSPARGAAVFRARGCGLCHAVRGVGGKTGPGAPPDLGRQPQALVRDYADVAAVLWNHAVPMWDRMRREGVPLRPLQGRDMADLVAYLFFVNFADEPGDPAIGAQIFRSKRCAQCHAVSEPQGARVGPRLGMAGRLDRPQDLIAAMWRAAPEMRNQMQARRMEWPLFAPGELAHLAAFLRKYGVRTQPE